MKPANPAFDARMEGIRRGDFATEFLVRVDVEWVDGVTTSYTPIRESGVRQTSLQDENPYWFEVPATAPLTTNIRNGAHRNAPITVMVSYDGGATWDKDYEGLIDNQSEVDDNPDNVRFTATGLLAALDNARTREGSPEYHRRFVDRTDSLYDEIGKDRRRTRRTLGAEV